MKSSSTANTSFYNPYQKVPLGPTTTTSALSSTLLPGLGTSLFVQSLVVLVVVGAVIGVIVGVLQVEQIGIFGSSSITTSQHTHKHTHTSFFILSLSYSHHVVIELYFASYVLCLFVGISCFTIGFL
jgi:hypothetical protein